MRSPSGVSYVITNRAAMSSVLPELFGDHRVQPVSEYPGRLLAALKASAPTGVVDPTVVLLTPGVYDVDRSIRVGLPGTLVLGLGIATLTAVDGAVPLVVSGAGARPPTARRTS